MGNLTFIIPTENKKNFNKEYISKKLKENFSDFIFENNANNITVRKKDVTEKMIDYITDIYFNQECYIPHIDDDINHLEKIKEEELEMGNGGIEFWDNQIKELKELKEIGFDKNNCIQTTHGPWNDEKNDIDFFIKDMFKAYIFDEGIHPEFMGPSYQRKKQKKIKSFSDFFKKKK